MAIGNTALPVINLVRLGVDASVLFVQKLNPKPVIVGP